MFTDFDEIFNNENKKNAPIPEIILDTLNNQVGEGLKYVDNGQGICELIATESTMRIGGVRLVVDEGVEKGIEGEITQEKIFEYAYNAQRAIKMEFVKEGYVILNGQEISIDKMVVNPYANIKMEAGNMYCYPSKFPEPFPLEIASEKYSKLILVERVPSEKLNILKFQTVEKEPIDLKYSLDMKTNQMSLTVNVNLKNVASVEETVTVLSIFYAFINGKGKLAGTEIVCDEEKKVLTEFNELTLMFWEKVYCLERTLGIRFSVLGKKISEETMIDVETAYQMLINKTPIKDTSNIESLNCNIEVREGRGLDEVTKGRLTFRFESDMSLEIFDEKISLPAITVMADVCVSEIREEDEKIKLMVDNSKVKAYTVNLAFLTEEERDAYLETEVMPKFFEAKTISEYIR